jgi:hypothetical protein
MKLIDILVASLLAATTLQAVAQGVCPKGEKRLRPTEECLPAILFNYLYCLEKSGGGKIEVKKRETGEKTKSIEIGFAGAASGVVLKGQASTGYKKNDTEKAVKELEEKIDPSLASKCQAIAKFAAAPAQKPQPTQPESILNISSIPDLSETKRQFGRAVEDFKPEGNIRFTMNPDAPFPGHFAAYLPPVEGMADISVYLNRGVSAKYYLTARIFADQSVGTIELKGLGADENSRVHFIIDNASEKYYVWAGEQYQKGWLDLNIPKIQGGYTMGILHKGREVVFFLNEKKVVSFLTAEAPRPGLVGLAFKRNRYISQDKKWLPTNSDREAVALVDSVAVYEF